MVEQIDRENEALQEWAEQGRSIERAIAEAVAAERARILASLREPDAAMVAAVRNLETAIDALAATRSHSTYLSMIDNDNAAQALLRLDGARQAARAALTAWEAQHG